MNDEINKWVEEVRKTGLNNQQISKQLKSRGYTNDNINKLLNIKSNSSNKRLSIVYRILYSVTSSLLVLIFLIVDLSSSRTYFFPEAFSEWYFIAAILIIPMIFNVSFGKRVLIFIVTTIIFSILGVSNSEGEAFAPLGSFFIYNIYAIGVRFIGHLLFSIKLNKNTPIIFSIAILLLFIGVSIYTLFIIQTKYTEYTERIIYQELRCDGDLMSIEKFERSCGKLGKLDTKLSRSLKDACLEELEYFSNNNSVRADFIISENSYQYHCNKFTMPLIFKYPKI